ncbi:DinB family protein [Sciscionella marina]|uniref:DinB family protein n=1 Tax=Sciscionella marina TaxID=508770 RepID=UPI00037597DB|nr:DinB family protein [Sciscionella marina]
MMQDLNLDVRLADYVRSLDKALNGLVDVVRRLGPAAHERPDIPGANTAVAVLSHCTGVMRFWGAKVAAGADVSRDREAEFRSDHDAERVIADARAQRDNLVALIESGYADCLARPEAAEAMGARLHSVTIGGVLLHILHEVAQHHGQMQITRDLLLRRECR